MYVHTYKKMSSQQCILTFCLHVYVYTNTRNELASLAHSFYTCLKHQLIHLTIVLLRSIYIYTLGSLVVWSFIPRDTLYCRIIHDRPRCGAARPAQLHHPTRMCTSLTDHVTWSISQPKKLLSCLTASLIRAPKKRRLQ